MRKARAEHEQRRISIMAVVSDPSNDNGWLATPAGQAALQRYRHRRMPAVTFASPAGGPGSVVDIVLLWMPAEGTEPALLLAKQPASRHRSKSKGARRGGAPRTGTSLKCPK